MIEPHSAQEGASSWTLKATRVVPTDAPVAGALVGAWPLPLPLAVRATDSTTGRLIEIGADSTATAVGRSSTRSSSASAAAGASDSGATASDTAPNEIGAEST